MRALPHDSMPKPLAFGSRPHPRDNGITNRASCRGSRAGTDPVELAGDSGSVHKYIVFTTFPEPPFSAADVLEWYRLRWQVELVFKRFKSLPLAGIRSAGPGC